MSVSRIFTSILFALGIVNAAVAGVGQTDNRYPVTNEMWDTPPYNSFVQVFVVRKKTENGGISGGTCTGQYIAKNLILSAGHCTEGAPLYYLARNHNYKSKDFRISLLKTNWDSTKAPGDLGDWAIFLVENPDYYGDAFFDPNVPTKTTEVINAGYGYVRILSDQELEIIRDVFNDVIQENKGKKIKVNAFLDDFNDRLTARGVGLLTMDDDNLKASKCNIVFEDCKSPTAACNNQILPREKNYPDILATTCDSWQGNSGGGYVFGNQLYGICSFGSDAFGDVGNDDYMASTKQFLDTVNTLKQQYPPQTAVSTADYSTPAQKPSAALTSTTNTGTATTPAVLMSTLPQISSTATIDSLTNVALFPAQIPTKQDVDNLTAQLQTQETNLENKIPNVPNMSNAETLALVDNIAEYQVTKDKLDALLERYNAARGNEQSLANRTLTAATTAATGLGMMATASAIAEQRADADAERDMTAYLATMKCEYGRGQSVRAGAEEVTLPGGNELLAYYSEYKALADSVKNTKKALGLRPGIESEVLYDRAETGLYQYASTGKTDGAYTSLSRALTDGDSKDAAEWATQKEESATKLKIGATAAGVGAAGGVVGNILINSNSADTNDTASDN